MFDLSVSCVLRPCFSSLTQVFCMCKTGLHPLYANIESITPDLHVVLRNDELSQWCTLGENTILSWNFSEGSPYNGTIVLSKIRCIKGLTSHANHKWHDMAIILCFWSPSSKHRHDLHRRRHDTITCIIVSPSVLSCQQCFYYYCYWSKFALEAIIKLLFISLYHDKCLLFMLELY